MNAPGIVLHPTAASALDQFLTAPAHALLLGGSAGSGKTHIARSVAAQLLGIKEASIENHGYYRTVTPKTNSISIEQIRELIAFFRLKVPGSGAIKRVAVVQDADA